MASFTIPSEFLSDLETSSLKDTRTDAEILTSLNQYHPVTSEKNIWAYWHSGLSSMPAWCVRNILSWVRICGPSWTVRVLNTVPGSQNHALKFVPNEMLPEAFVKGTMDGPYVGPHSSDFLRGALLVTHGGVNMDVGNILVRDLDRVCWNELEDENSPFEVAVPIMYGQTMANHFVAARKGNPFIQRWHELFTYLWKDRTNHEGISSHPLMAFAKDLSFEDAADWSWDFKISFTTLVEYIAQVVCWRRLCMLEDAGDGFSPSDYWQQHILCMDASQENWGGEVTLGFDKVGPRMYDLFRVKLDADKDTEEYKDAYKLVWTLLTKSSLQKVTHGKGLTFTPHLGTLWDENEGTDCEPGTFGELLRYGAVNFRQKREKISKMEAIKCPVALKKGVLEP
ncbi:Fc.00g099830.m01.CDS01 [Cosmosporella sp. VM-42]